MELRTTTGRTIDYDYSSTQFLVFTPSGRTYVGSSEQRSSSAATGEPLTDDGRTLGKIRIEGTVWFPAHTHDAQSSIVFEAGWTADLVPTRARVSWQ